MTHFRLYEKIKINSENYVSFVDQYVSSVYGFSSQYGNSNSISYTAYNIIGPPSKFPDYGDFPQAYVMRTYGQWWNKVPSRSIDYMPQNNPDVISHDYIDLEFHESVYPIRISIYEIYNPGSVVRIWAQDSYCRWFQLWSGLPQTVSPQSRIFSPPLQPCNFKTKMIRLEFNHSHLDYYTELDAVLLIGTFELILPKDQSFNFSLTKLLQSMNNIYPDEKDIHNLTPNHSHAKMDLYRFKESLPKHCIIYKSDIVDYFHKSKLISTLEQYYYNVPPFKEGYDNMQQFLQEDFPKFVESNCHTSSHKPQELLCGNFSVLPDEMILKILTYLDLKLLYHVCNVNKRLNKLARDSLFYKCLNLRPYWYSFDENALSSLATRCQEQHLRQLDLSWCGNHGMLTSVNIKTFLKSCGKSLTHLRLNCCEMVDDSVIDDVSSTCKNLKELCLRNCRKIKTNGFVHLQKLNFLEILDLYRTCIETADVCKILRNNPRIRHLNIAGVLERLNADEIAKELGNSCPNLESVDFWKASTLTSQGINALTRCKNLREIDFSWCGTIINQNESFYKLFTCCKHLEKVFLASFRGLAERDLKQLTLCKELKQLDLLGAICLTSDICQDILLCCTKLEMIDISFCDLISNSNIDEWRKQFPNVAIKRSFIIQQT